MSFPINPNDGQKTTRNNIVYTYSTSTNSWRRDFNNLLDRLTLGGNYESTSTTEGTLVVNGGAGITGNLNVGGDTELFGNLTVDGQVVLSPIGYNVYIEPISGNVVINPESIGYIDNMIIGETTPQTGNFTNIVVESTAQSYGTDTGALTVAGGVGITQDLYVGGTIYGTVYGFVGGVTTSTNNLTGGSAGVVAYQSNTGTTGFTNVGTTGTVLVSHGTGAPQFEDHLSLAGTGTSTSTTTGALTVAGGVGIQGDLNIGGAVTIGGIPLTNIAGGKPWQIINTSSYLAVTGDRLMISTTQTAVTVTLPFIPTFGDTVEFLDYGDSFGVNTATIARNSQLIMGIPEDLILDLAGAANTLIFAGTDEGWKLGEVI